MGHQGSLQNKITAIEYLDSRVLKTVYEKLSRSGEDFRILVMPDHPTPVRVRTHTSDPIPYMLYDSTNEGAYSHTYCEKDAAASGKMFAEGYKLMDYFLR